MNSSATFSDTNKSLPILSGSKKNPGNSIIERISNGDKAAVEEFIKVYGNKLWALAANFISATHLEEVTRNIFLDIWKNAANYNANKHSEEDFIKLIAVRRIMTFKGSSI